MKYFLYLLIALILILTLVFALGPRPNYPEFDAKIQATSLSINELNDYVAKKDANIPKLRAGNESRLIWADSSQQKTEYAMLFLHGFSASPMSGDPVIPDIAKRYGCNLYIPLLAGHGIDDIESFKDITPKDLIESAKEAIAIAQKLGDKVILLSSSTGSTLATYLAAHNPELVHSILMYSPNIDINDPNSKLLTYPWGLQIARKVMGGNHRSFTLNRGGEQYWTTQYRLEGVVALRSLINETMTQSTFEKLKMPIFCAYWYENEEKRDMVISIDAIHQFFDQISTPEPLQESVSVNSAAAHCMLSKFQSNDLDIVRKKSYNFIENVLKLTPITKD